MTRILARGLLHGFQVVDLELSQRWNEKNPRKEG